MDSSLKPSQFSFYLNREFILKGCHVQMRHYVYYVCVMKLNIDDF